MPKSKLANAEFDRVSARRLDRLARQVKTEPNEAVSTESLRANGHTTLNAPGLVGSPKSKQRRVSLVPGWVTAWEYEMLLALFSILYFFRITREKREKEKKKTSARPSSARKVRSGSVRQALDFSGGLKNSRFPFFLFIGSSACLKNSTQVRWPLTVTVARALERRRSERRKKAVGCCLT